MKKDLYQQVCKAYSRFCKNNMQVFQQPSESCSIIGRKYVHLRNTYGNLAKYDLRKRKFV